MYSQNKIDINILDFFSNNSINNGVFVEAGGSHPSDQSNTFLLEQNGWTGLVIEPKVNFNELYQQVRPKTILENFVLVDFDFKFDKIKGDFRHYMEGGIFQPSHITDWVESEHNCCTLQNLLDKHNLNEIHFMSLDTEGSEDLVLKGISFDKVFIHLIVIECHDENSNSKLMDYYNFELINKYKQHEYYINKKSFLLKNKNDLKIEE